jgi:hypothetical protein
MKANFNMLFRGRSRIFYDFFGSVSLVLAIALAGLLVEHFLPPRPDHPFGAGEWVQVVALCVLLVGVVAFNRMRAMTVRTHGTLYYLKLLSAGMRDEHIAFLREHHKQKGLLDARIISRALDTHAAQVMDVVPSVREFSRDLQLTMNEDSLETGFTFAPNMLFPMALAVGYELMVWDRFDLTESVSEAANTENQAQVLTWSPATPASGDTQLQIVHHAGSSNEDGNPVLVDIHLTRSRALASLPIPFRATYRVGAWDGQELGPVHLVNAGLPTPKTNETVSLVHEAAQLVARAISEALHHFQDTPVFVRAVMPKTVSMAVGWLLADQRRISQPVCERDRCAVCQNVFQWLRPLVFVQQDLQLARVHPAMPSAQRLALEWPLL